MDRVIEKARVTAAAACLLLAASAAGAAPTVVSITFGGGRANQLIAKQLLDQHGFKGTFYVMSGEIGVPAYLTAADVKGIANAGHEIGGLTLDHADLTAVSYSSMVYEVCQDRQNLLALGIAPVVSFDYPYGHSDATVESVVQSCGYASGRRSFGLDCAFTGCAAAEALPPADPYFVRTPPVVTSTTALGEIKQYVLNAENAGGGWVPLAFINICDGCDEWAVTQTNFASLLDWLAARGSVVKTVGQVIAGDYTNPPPPPPQPPNPSAGIASDFSQARLFPNPWRLDRHAGRSVTIDGLPPRSEIRIFTLAGRIVKTVEAEAGGQGTWGLVDDAGQSVASGIYLYVITAPGLARKRGTFTVVR